MSAKRIFVNALPVPLAAIVATWFVLYPFHGKSGDDDQLSANTARCARARRHLSEADRCFADAIAGLRRVNAAEERLVIGDRNVASRRVQRITEIRERLHQVSEDFDRAFQGIVLPEINPVDED
jgi:hypothetical protein